jgi:hypothetical protein
MGRKSRAKAGKRAGRSMASATNEDPGTRGQYPCIDSWGSPEPGEQTHSCEDPDCEMCNGDSGDFHDRMFYRRYPTAEAFAEAAAETSDGRVQLWWELFDAGCQRAWLRAEGNALVRENRFYLPYYFSRPVYTGLLNAGYQEREWTHPAVGRAVSTLEAYGARHDLPAQARVFAEPSTDIFPRFGFAVDVQVPEQTTWDQVLDWVVDGPEDRTLGLANPWFDEQDQATREFRALCHEHGLPQFTCGACKQPLTNRYPGWSGAWVCFGDDEGGPNCRESPNGAGLDMPASYDRPSMPLPHRALTASGEPVPAIPEPRPASQEHPAMAARPIIGTA